jgi:hypothetical protein
MCQNDQTWSISVDFSAVPDGSLTLNAHQALNSATSGVGTISLTKSSGLCDDPINYNAVPFAGGTGTAMDPYLICSSDQLLRLNTHLSSSMRLENDIDMDGVAWPLPGTYSGVFDGNGFVIEKLSYNTGSWPTGFVRELTGTIKNLGLIDINYVGYCHLGGIVGIAQVGSFVSNSFVEGQIAHSNMATNNNSVGGLVGHNSGTISNSYSKVTINGGGGGGSDDIGGLVGYNDTGAISSSYSDSAINVINGDNVGGLVGQNRGSISSSYALGSVTGDSTSSAYGGLVGYVGSSSSLIENSFSAVVVSAQSPMGGLVAQTVGGATVNNSYWDLNTSGQVTSAAGSGLTTTQLNDGANLPTWDFATIWKWTVGVDYPELVWQ